MAYGGARAFQALGSGIKDFGATIGNLRRQREEDNRRRAAEDIQLAGMGGGRGPVPTVSREMPIPEPTREFNPPDFGPSASYGVQAPTDFMPEPDLRSTAPRMTEQVQDPQYMAIGDDDYGYITRPGFMEQEERSRQQSEDARLRRELTEAVGRAMNDKTTPGDVVLMDEAGIPWEELIPVPEGPDFDPKTDPSIQRGEYWREQGLSVTGQPLDEVEEEGPPRGKPTFSQAWEELGEMYPGDYGEQPRLSPQLRAPLAGAWSGGADIRFPDPGQVEMGIELPPDYYIPEPGEPHGSLHAPSPPLTIPEPSGGIAQSTFTRPTITKDQAEYLATVRGMSQEEIDRQYVVR